MPPKGNRQKNQQKSSEVVSQKEFTKNSKETLVQAKIDAIELGLDPKVQAIAHQAKDGTWLPGADGKQLVAILEDEKIKEMDDIRSIKDKVRDISTLAKEDLVKNTKNKGRARVITAESVTLIAREVQSKSQVELLVTGIDSGAQKRVVITIMPGTTRLGKLINGELPNFNFGAGDKRRTKKKKKSVKGAKNKRAKARSKAAVDRAKASIADIANNLDGNQSVDPVNYADDGIDDGILNMEK